MSYNLKIKLMGMENEISRELIVPKNITFTTLSNIFNNIFDLTYFNRPAFSFPGLDLKMSSEDIGERSISSDVELSVYLEYFKKFQWIYLPSKRLIFEVKVKNAKTQTFPEVIDFKGKYNPLDYRDVYDLDDMIYKILNNHTPKDDLFEFNIEEVNRKLRDYDD